MLHLSKYTSARKLLRKKVLLNIGFLVFVSNLGVIFVEQRYPFFYTHYSNIFR